MTGLTIVLFDDRTARGWEPFALTRPAGELLFGTLTFRARHESVFQGRCLGHLGADHLTGFAEEGAPPVLPSPPASSDSPRVYLLSRFIPDFDAALPDRISEAGPLVTGSGAAIGWYDPRGNHPPDPEFIFDLNLQGRSPVGTLPGRVIENVWDLVSLNPDQITLDILHFASLRKNDTSLPAGVFHWGDHPLLIDPEATVEPGSAFDTSAGPIWLDRGSHVRAFSRVAGPVYLGPGSTILGGPVEASTIGPVCRVRGELAESVALGYVNKQHDGHIGHAYLGRWVNLGAETTNSDLKNNYGTIRLWTPDGERDTGAIKMGSLIGDHVKTGIGLLLNTGTVIGAGSNLYGSAMPPAFVPPFSWGTGTQLTEYRLDKFLEVAKMAMSRRKVELPESARQQLETAWKKGRAMTPSPDGPEA
ncbi:MAG: hypothetical protein LBG44_09030 [Gemmatimonadota bacterium]|jgi:UDP-N-acetylglucosamine diphosphorylase/glucosamine-1-phosphate N-acetyltransferase|nr:hypothetical protein [Gemmatimonadota bacterium]